MKKTVPRYHYITIYYIARTPEHFFMDLEQKTYRGVTSLKLVEIGELRCKGYHHRLPPGMK